MQILKVVIDDNVIIDALKPNLEFEGTAKQIFRLIGEERITAFICANSLTDIFFILKKCQGETAAKITISNLMKSFGIIPLTDTDCEKALALPVSDFEDAVISVCAEKINADFIVSRDEKFIKSKTVVEVIPPHKFLAIF
jgi:predicted nucleic acid-binding protein